MQREIEFRIFDKTMKRWLCSDSQYLVMDGSKLLPAPWSSFEFDVGNDNFIIQQYTGLKDKNGVKIFEGDILEIWDGRNLPVEFGEYFTGFERRDSHNGWYLASGEAISDLALDERYAIDEYGVSVIGNIFNVSYQVKINKQTA